MPRKNGTEPGTFGECTMEILLSMVECIRYPGEYAACHRVYVVWSCSRSPYETPRELWPHQCTACFSRVVSGSYDLGRSGAARVYTGRGGRRT